MAKKNPFPFPLAEILGRVELSASALEEARQFAHAHFEEQKDQDFCGEPVDFGKVPAWAKKSRDWFPSRQLRAWGMKATSDRSLEGQVSTVAVDQHVDGISGLCFCLVLHNDGLTFRQGRVSHKPVAGDWFIFNDRANHGVKDSLKTTSFVAIVVPLVDAQSGLTF